MYFVSVKKSLNTKERKFRNIRQKITQELSIQKRYEDCSIEKSERMHDQNWSIRQKLDSLYRAHKVKKVKDEVHQEVK